MGSNKNYERQARLIATQHAYWEGTAARSEKKSVSFEKWFLLGIRRQGKKGDEFYFLSLRLVRVKWSEQVPMLRTLEDFERDTKLNTSLNFSSSFLEKVICCTPNIYKGENKMFKVKVGNDGIVNVNRLPEKQSEYNQIIDAREGKESLVVDKYIKVFDVRNGECENDLIPLEEEKEPSRPEWRFFSKTCFPLYDDSQNYLGYYEDEVFVRIGSK